jgi:hypothetical protein
MTFVVPLALTTIFGLITYLVWRKLAPDRNPDYNMVMPLTLMTGSLVIWGLFGFYHLNNWYWGFSG